MYQPSRTEIINWNAPAFFISKFHLYSLLFSVFPPKLPKFLLFVINNHDEIITGRVAKKHRHANLSFHKQ